MLSLVASARHVSVQGKSCLPHTRFTLVTLPFSALLPSVSQTLLNVVLTPCTPGCGLFPSQSHFYKVSLVQEAPWDCSEEPVCLWRDIWHPFLFLFLFRSRKMGLSTSPTPHNLGNALSPRSLLPSTLSFSKMLSSLLSSPSFSHDLHPLNMG